MSAIGDETNEFPACKIIYAGTTVDEGYMTNLRRLEATAQYLLTPEPTTPPKLPPEIANEWLHDFLEPVFKRAREAKETREA